MLQGAPQTTDSMSWPGTAGDHDKACPSRLVAGAAQPEVLILKPDGIRDTGFGLGGVARVATKSNSSLATAKMVAHHREYSNYDDKWQQISVREGSLSFGTRPALYHFPDEQNLPKFDEHAALQIWRLPRGFKVFRQRNHPIE